MIHSDISPMVKEAMIVKYHVECSVTGAQIPLNDLLYWNVEKQKAYSSPYVVDHSDYYQDFVAQGIESTT
jgi:hypothetical protein